MVRAEQIRLSDSIRWSSKNSSATCRQRSGLTRVLRRKLAEGTAEMTDMWTLAIVTVPAAVATLREVGAVWRYRLRRASIERVLRDLGPGSRVVDQDPTGAVISVTVYRCSSRPGADSVLRQGALAA